MIDTYRFEGIHYRYLLDGRSLNDSEFKAKKILEDGCCLVAVLQKFKEVGADGYAIDAAKSAVRTSKKRLVPKYS